MKIFLDTANIDEIKEVRDFIDGITTNPTLLGKEIQRTGEKPYNILKTICELVNGPVSAEGISLDTDGIIKEGRELAKIHKNICVKVPVTIEGLKAISILHNEGIKTNATLVFSCNQALLAAKAGADFISPFIGRLDDAGHYGMELVKEIMTMIKNYNFKSEVLVASVRHPLHVVEAIKIGAHICSMPYNVFKLMIKHPLTDQGIKRFLDDWEQAQKYIK